MAWDHLREYRLGRNAYRVQMVKCGGSKKRGRSPTYWYVLRFNDVLYAAEHWQSGSPKRWAHLKMDRSSFTGAEAAFREVQQMAIAKRNPASGGSDGSAPAGDKEFTKRFPTLWEYLTLSTFDDGSSRKTSSLSVFTQDGDVKVILRDKDAGECLFVTADGVLAAFAVLELKLLDPQADWRKDRFQGDSQAAGKGGKAGRRGR